MQESFVELNGINKTVYIKRSAVVRITVEKVLNKETPYMVNIKTEGGKYDTYLMFKESESAQKEVDKILK